MINLRSKEQIHTLLNLHAQEKIDELFSDFQEVIRTLMKDNNTKLGTLFQDQSDFMEKHAEELKFSKLKQSLDIKDLEETRNEHIIAQRLI